MSPSLRAHVAAKVVLPLLRDKQRMSDPERTRREIAALAVRPKSFAPPRLLDRRARVTVRRHDGWPVYDLTPRRGTPVRHVLYLHGGAYIHEIDVFHWLMLSGFVKHAPARCVVPIYPLGTALGAAGTVAGATAIARDMIDDAGTDQVVLMGDSAGGGMALAVAQALRDEGRTAHRVVLIAPWLDVDVDQPAQRAIEPRDAMLAIPGLAESGRVYAGDLPIDDPRVSPIHGDPRGLPPITIFVGTDDLLNPDSHRLHALCADAGVPCELIEAPQMQHDYPLFPIPEGRAARRRIVELLRR